MNKKQYNNVIDWTLTHDQSAQTEDSLETARTVFKNMGVALPQGDLKQVSEVLKTDDYMGWRSCTMQEAQAAADRGTAAIGISEEKIVILAANDEEQPVAETAAVMTLSDTAAASAASDLAFYSYRSGTTTIIGTLSIFAANDGSTSSWSISGHAFLTFKNTSCSPITVGGLTVWVDNEITIGTWGNKEPHDGIWYNLESYIINTYGSYENRVSLSIDITQNDVDLINAVIANNDTWSETNNCSSFATKVWNEVSSIALSAGTPNTPTSLMLSIKSKAGYETARSVQNNTNIGYMSNGEFVAATVNTWAFSAGMTAARNNAVEFIVPINLNPNSSDMEVW
ncbi:MAG: hypothetical protein IJN07_05155 [Clostridia bacterium]|nr:hypothetical protein [Clostridia bacterium]